MTNITPSKIEKTKTFVHQHRRKAAVIGLSVVVTAYTVARNKEFRYMRPHGLGDDGAEFQSIFGSLFSIDYD